MTLSQYSQLKKQIVISVSTTNKPNKILFDLKEQYKDKINSSRRNEQIQTIGQLLLVLEIRDILSENDVEPLREIAQRLGNHQLSCKINEFKRIHVPTEEHNYYDLHRRERKSSHKQIKCNDGMNKNSYINVNQTEKQRIYEIIIQELGIYWRDLARNLKFSECMIDEIDKKCETLHSKALRLLEVYDNEQKDPQQWVLILCKSLEQARRKDLAKAIQEI